MKNTELVHKIKENFNNQCIISTKEITDLLIDTFPGLSTSTISWRLNQLKKEKHIFQIGRGKYTFDFKPEYLPELSLKTKRQYNRIKQFCKNDLVVWDTQMLNEIAGSDINRYWIFISVAKEELEPLFDQMLDFSKHTFLQPDKEVTLRVKY